MFCFEYQECNWRRTTQTLNLIRNTQNDTLNCSEQLDAIAVKKLVRFVNDLMEQYFDFVRRRVQLEVCLTFCYFFVRSRQPFLSVQKRSARSKIPSPAFHLKMCQLPCLKKKKKCPKCCFSCKILSVDSGHLIIFFSLFFFFFFFCRRKLETIQSWFVLSTDSTDDYRPWTSFFQTQTFPGFVSQLFIDLAEKGNFSCFTPIDQFCALWKGEEWLVIFDLHRAGTEIVSKAARDRVAYYLQSLKQNFSGILTRTWDFVGQSTNDHCKTKR